MKVVRLHAQNCLKHHDENPPIPKSGEVLLRVDAVGICGSDIHWMLDAGIGDAQLKRPLILGHEFSGVDLETGHRFAVDPAIPCGFCESCQEGNPNYCPEVRFAGHNELDGALRELIAWPKKNLFRLPEKINAIDGAMLEPLGVAIYALDLARLNPRMDIGIFGCGPIGLLILQLVKRIQGTQTFVTDRLSHRIDKAQRLGADQSYLVNETGYLTECVKKIGKRGLDVVFETAGDGAAVESAVEAARPGGTVILVGIPSDDRISFSASAARRKGLQLINCRRMKNTYHRAIHMVQNEEIDVRSLVSHRFPLEMAEKAFEVAVRREGIKVIIEPNHLE